MSRLIVERYESWGRDRFRRYHLVLDGKPSGSIGHRDHQAIDVAPGTHRLQALTQQFESDVVTFTIRDNDDVFLELRARILETTGVAASTVAWSTLEFRFIDAPELPAHSEWLVRLAGALQIGALLASTAALSLAGFGGRAQAHEATACIAIAVTAILSAAIVREFSRPRRSRGRRRRA